jgi:N-acetyl-beta-hexosaminidase
MHLDVARHFMQVEFVKKYIDLMSQYKFNYFHWHLTEDQGWRIEIKKYPKLTEIGSKRPETMKERNFARTSATVFHMADLRRTRSKMSSRMRRRDT